MSKKRKKLKVKKLSVGGGADMGGGGAASGSSGSTGGGGGREAHMGMKGKTRSSGRDAGMGMGGKTRSTSTIKSSKPQGSSKKTITPKKPPPQLPVIGPATYLANKMIQGFYTAKNLKEQKEEDVLGGEMLTTSKRTNITNIGEERGGDARDGGQKKDPIILPQVAVKPTVPIPLQKVTPRRFAFELKRGGLSGGVKSGPPPKKGPNPQGMKKGGMTCPHRPDGIRGQGAAIKGFKFTGVK